MSGRSVLYIEDTVLVFLLILCTALMFSLLLRIFIYYLSKYSRTSNALFYSFKLLGVAHLRALLYGIGRKDQRWDEKIIYRRDEISEDQMKSLQR